MKVAVVSPFGSAVSTTLVVEAVAVGAFLVEAFLVEVAETTLVVGAEVVAVLVDEITPLTALIGWSH